MHLLRCSLLSLTVSCGVFGQSYTIKTFAGGGLPVNIPGTAASIGNVSAVAVDSAGNTFFVSSAYNGVLRLNAAGVLTLVAGNGTPGFSGDGGPATSAQLNFPNGVAVDPAGNLYISDSGNNRIRVVSSGVITTIAGNGTAGFSGDNGLATSAQISAPNGVAADSSGNLYISDHANNRIRRVSSGVIITVAGNGTYGYSGDNGPATSAQLAQPYGVAVDSTGNIYIVDGLYDRIRKVSNGVITVVAGSGTAGFSGDNGPATSAQLSAPNGVAVDAAGNLYIADDENNRIRKVSHGVITTVAGNGTGGFSGDNGPAASAQLNEPKGVAVDSGGNLYIADSINGRLRKISNGLITTLAGDGTAGFSGDNGPAASAQLTGPYGVAVDSGGNLYIADSVNNRIRKISNGVITTVAGNGTSGFSGDNGPATSAQLYLPFGVAVDAAGNLYIADSADNRIRKVSNGIITTVAGNGTFGFSGDNGAATAAQLSNPVGVAVDSAGNLYIADTANNRIRKVSNGVITTVAGNGFAGFSGDNGNATTAQLNLPSGLAVDAAGNLYIGDRANQRVRKVSNGVITTVAGNGIQGFSGDNGLAISAQFASPAGVAVDSSGNLYIADTSNNRIRVVSAGVITTVAGNGTQGFSGDSLPAASAQLNRPNGVAVDSAGNVYIADTGNQRIRVLTPVVISCTFSVTPSLLQPPVSAGNLTVTIQTDASCPWAVSGLPAWITVSGSPSGIGSATVTLIVAANPGAARSASISVAGVPVSVTQAGTSFCTSSIDPAGQAWPVAGGAGIINVTINAGCQWTATSNLSWVTITGPGSGTGSGTVTYQVAANTGGYRSGAIAVAGLFFSVEQASATISGFTNTGSMSELAFAGAWTTTFTLINTGPDPVQIRLNFFDNNGNPLVTPLIFPQTPAAGTVLGSTLDRTVNPGAVLVIEAKGLTSAQTQVGWTQLLSSGNIGGFAIFRQSIGNSIQEAEVPIETRTAGSYLLWFDNTSNYATGIALANTGSLAASFGIIIRDDSGAVLFSSAITLPAQGHASFDLASTYALTAGKRGTVEFDTSTNGQISVLGLLFNPTGAFSSIPAVTK